MTHTNSTRRKVSIMVDWRLPALIGSLVLGAGVAIGGPLLVANAATSGERPQAPATATAPGVATTTAPGGAATTTAPGAGAGATTTAPAPEPSRSDAALPQVTQAPPAPQPSWNSEPSLSPVPGRG